MATDELDLTADQIVQWLKDEIASGRPVDIRTTREYVTEPLPDREETGLSEETDASSRMTVGILEAWPVGADDGWRLRVRVEDILGPHAPEDGSVPDRPEEIDLDDFEAEFVAPDRGAVFVSVTTETPLGKRRFDQVFANLLRDRHTR